MTARLDGWCDGILGRQCNAPKQWPACDQYLKYYMQGKEYRRTKNITLTYERENNDT